MDLQIETSFECKFDYVEVFDGPTMANETAMSGKLCGTEAPEGQMKTTGSNMIVHFASDYSTNAAGFRIVATATLGTKISY